MTQRKLDKQFRTNIAQNFVRQIQSDNDDCLFACVGSSEGEFLTSRTERQEQVQRRKILTATRILPKDISLVINRVDWTSGTVYDRVEDDVDMSTQNFYVMNSQNNVYICIDNNGGKESLREPFGTDLDNITMGDRYVWKFVFSVPSDKLKFLDLNHIPVLDLKVYDNESQPYSDVRQYQYSVQKGAATDEQKGQIVRVDVSATNTGVYNNYLRADIDRVVLGASADSVVISDAVNTNSTYSNYAIRIIDGNAAGQIKTIKDNIITPSGFNQVRLSTGSGNTFDPIPEVNSHYEILPRISISGDGVSGAAYAIMDPDSLKISRIVVSDQGEGYSTASASISPAPSSGSAPTLTPVLFTPIGFDPVFELFTTKVKILATIVPDNSDATDRLVENDYRNIAVWLNPKIGSSYTNAGKVASFNDVSKTDLKFEQVPGGDEITPNYISVGDYAYGQSSKVFGLINAVSRADTNSGTMTIENLKDDFTYGETVNIFSINGFTFEDGGKRVKARTTLSDNVTLTPSQTEFRMTTKLGLETTVGAAVSNDNTVTGASGSSGVVAQYIEDVGSSPPTGTLLVTDLSRSASAATAGFAVNEVLTLPDSTGATITSVSMPELDAFSGTMLYIEGIDPVVRQFEQTDVLQLTFDF